MKPGREGGRGVSFAVVPGIHPPTQRSKRLLPIGRSSFLVAPEAVYSYHRSTRWVVVWNVIGDDLNKLQR